MSLLSQNDSKNLVEEDGPAGSVGVDEERKADSGLRYETSASAAADGLIFSRRCGLLLLRNKRDNCNAAAAFWMVLW